MWIFPQNKIINVTLILKYLYFVPNIIYYLHLRHQTLPLIYITKVYIPYKVSKPAVVAERSRAEIVKTTFRSRFGFRFLKYPLLKKSFLFGYPKYKQSFLFVSWLSENILIFNGTIAFITIPQYKKPAK